MEVVTWLLENRSLSDLIPGRRKGRKGAAWAEGGGSLGYRVEAGIGFRVAGVSVGGEWGGGGGGIWL